MICYLPSPITAATIGSTLTASQLAGFSGLVRVIGTPTVSSVIFEYLNKPFTSDATSVTAASTVTVLPPNSILPAGTIACAYTAATNTFTITGITNYASFTVGAHYIFKGSSKRGQW